MFDLETRFARRYPAEICRCNNHRLVIARWRILDFAPIHVLPDCLVAILANFAPVDRLANENASIERSSIAQSLITITQLRIAHEPAAARATHLKQQHQGLAGIGL